MTHLMHLNVGHAFMTWVLNQFSSYAHSFCGFGIMGWYPTLKKYHTGYVTAAAAPMTSSLTTFLPFNIASDSQVDLVQASTTWLWTACLVVSWTDCPIQKKNCPFSSSSTRKSLKLLKFVRSFRQKNFSTSVFCVVSWIGIDFGE